MKEFKLKHADFNHYLLSVHVQININERIIQTLGGGQHDQECIDYGIHM